MNVELADKSGYVLAKLVFYSIYDAPGANPPQKRARFDGPARMWGTAAELRFILSSGAYYLLKLVPGANLNSHSDVYITEDSNSMVTATVNMAVLGVSLCKLLESKWQNKMAPPVANVTAAPAPAPPGPCPECFGTGYRNGFGPFCSRGCLSKS